MQYTEKEYRSLNRFANSDLSEFKRLLIGDRRPFPKAGFNFGHVFHGMLLEPEKLSHEDWISLSDDEQERANRMYEKAKNYPFIAEILKLAEKEQVHFFETEDTPCKCKIDLKYEDIITDIKTTSCQNYVDFCDTIEKFGYNRQGAFYLDGAQAKDFVIIGIRKHAPFEIFHVELTKWSGSGGITQGRTEYRQLLNQTKNTNFVPSSWKLEKVAY
jgi:hypothetical protein